MRTELQSGLHVCTVGPACAAAAAAAAAVTQLAFSPDGRYLASASRDRTVAVFERQEGLQGHEDPLGDAPQPPPPPFRLLGRLKAHARVVWGLHWSPDSRLLATASRDGKGEWGVRGVRG